MAHEIRRIAVSTGGGDAPGLNAVIRAVVHAANKRGWEVFGIRDGYNGIFLKERYPNGTGIIPLTRERVRGITHLGGTIIGTTNRGNPFKYPMPQPDGTIKETDRADEVIAGFREHGFDALIAIGGDGSLSIANDLAKRGNIRVIGVPKTIDNDLEGTVATFGFDSAVSFATEAIDRLHSTAESHHRVMVVEVMGRTAGWIALHAGVAGTADVILIPEIPYDIAIVAEKINERERAGRHFSIIVVAEGAMPKGGTASVIEKELGKAERFGGLGEKIAAQIQALTNKETRCVVLGHLLRGGSPSAFDRLLSLRFGAAAVRALEEGQSGVVVVLDPPTVRYIPMEQVAHRVRHVPLDCDTIATAKDLGISFGI
ncbi:MAG: ATP-dependent 6-phosphofructokinase [Bacteroidota bacterium]|nr:ATP-dependent 6-phosphofructokinase [Candidatus Kapabacteria bacterium]MDW8219940.1 ATP-dependent 6-phosphofructokinase [Bacteroidota bacterium]